jgi:predicted MFS family arabinose efflux permease
MAKIDSNTGRAVLTLAHVAGMVDMVALPLWVGGLMQHYGYAAPQAGLTVTAFLVAVVVASVWLAPRFNRLPAWANANMGFALAAMAFGIAAARPVGATELPLMLLLHAVAGLGIGCALSITHGCIGRSANPHRLFAAVNVALAVFAIVFLASMPRLVAAFGAPALFMAFSATMGIAAVVALVGFPHERSVAVAEAVPHRLPAAAWLVAGTVVCLTLNQAMVFSFVERIGATQGFGADRVHAVLIALGFVNLLPGALAGLLQKRLSPLTVGLLGPVAQAALALIMSSSTAFEPYAVAAALYVSAVIFTHTFLFGLLSAIDPSGRAVAATPAMMMLGSCTGPALGGVVVHAIGYPGLGWVASAVAAVAVVAMVAARIKLALAPVGLAAAPGVAR